MVINRVSYLKQLADSKNNGMIKVITGLRRSGKTYLLFNLFYGHLLKEGVNEDHIIRFAFDSEDDLGLIGENSLDLSLEKRKVDPRKFMDYVNGKIVDEDMHYLLLDEIQLLDRFEAVLNGYLRRNNLDIYVTGSNAKFLSKDVITEFRGRGWEIRVNPLSFGEFYSVYGGSKDEAYNEYARYGGLPKILDFPNGPDKEKYLKSIFDETYLKDIIERNKVECKSEIGELLDFLASSIGSLTNPTKLANTFESVKKVKIHRDTISKYIDFLSDSFLVSPTKRYDITGKGYINFPYKYYFSDMGLRNVRLNFRELEPQKLMENIVYNELAKRRYDVDVGVVELYEKNANGKSVLKKTEVDFVCNQFDKRYYIQVVYAIDGDGKILQEKRPLLNIKDGFKKIIIVRDSIRPHYNEDGIYIIGLYDFLLNENCFDY